MRWSDNSTDRPFHRPLRLAPRHPAKHPARMRRFALDARWRQIRRLAVRLRDPECLAMFREAMKHQGERKNLDDNVIEVERSPVGNSRAYSIDRVKRECEPEVVAKVTAPTTKGVSGATGCNKLVYVHLAGLDYAELSRTRFATF